MSDIEQAMADVREHKRLYEKAACARGEARLALDNAERERSVAARNYERTKERLLVIVGLTDTDIEWTRIRDTEDD